MLAGRGLLTIILLALPPVLFLATERFLSPPTEGIFKGGLLAGAELVVVGVEAAGN